LSGFKPVTITRDPGVLKILNIPALNSLTYMLLGSRKPGHIESSDLDLVDTIAYLGSHRIKQRIH
jgi:hypothetical protein